jgi:hypothetical protein
MCTAGFTLTNTGSVPEQFYITFGTIIVNNGGVDGDVLANLDQAGLYLTNGSGVVLGTGSPYSSPSTAVGVPLSTLFNNGYGTPIWPSGETTATYSFSDTVAPRTGDDGTIGLSLEPGTAATNSWDDLNAWNNASITIPYTITAEAGS